MTGMDNTNVYAYFSISALFFSLPPSIIIEGPKLMQHAFSNVITSTSYPVSIEYVYTMTAFKSCWPIRPLENG